MFGWHHRLEGHEFEEVPEVGDGQGNLESCSPWNHKELDTTELLRTLGLRDSIPGDPERTVCREMGRWEGGGGVRLYRSL